MVSSIVRTGGCSKTFSEMFMSLTSSLISSSEFSSSKSFSGSLSSLSDMMSFSIILSLPVWDVVIVVDSVQFHWQFHPLSCGFSHTLHLQLVLQFLCSLEHLHLRELQFPYHEHRFGVRNLTFSRTSWMLAWLPLTTDNIPLVSVHLYCKRFKGATD